MSVPAGDHTGPGTEVAISVLSGDGGQVLSAVLNDTPAARELLEQLPLRLRFSDQNAVEKLARLPRPLSMAGMPAGDDPEPGDVGFYAPTGDLVLYYRDVGYWPGIARLGRLSEHAVQVLSSQDEDFDAVVATGD